MSCPIERISSLVKTPDIAACLFQECRLDVRPEVVSHQARNEPAHISGGLPGAGLGTVALAAHTVVKQITDFCLGLLGTFSTVSQSLVASCLGEVRCHLLSPP